MTLEKKVKKEFHEKVPDREAHIRNRCTQLLQQEITQVTQMVADAKAAVIVVDLTTFTNMIQEHAVIEKYRAIAHELLLQLYDKYLT